MGKWDRTIGFPLSPGLWLSPKQKNAKNNVLHENELKGCAYNMLDIREGNTKT